MRWDRNVREGWLPSFLLKIVYRFGANRLKQLYRIVDIGPYLWRQIAVAGENGMDWHGWRRPVWQYLNKLSTIEKGLRHHQWQLRNAKTQQCRLAHRKTVVHPQPWG